MPAELNETLPLITTTKLSKTYTMGTTQVHALSDVSISINSGEFVAITGASGSGKSTLLHLLGCLDTPTSGEYLLEGTKIDKSVNLAHIRRDKIGFVFQFFNLLPKLTALQNVELPMIYKGLSAKSRRQRARQLLEQVGLGNRVNHKPNELSGGQAQRVALARALANEPRLVLADEPTGNLDSQSGEEILNELSKLNAQGTTLIIVSHDDYVAQKAHRIIKLLDGKVVEM